MNTYYYYYYEQVLLPRQQRNRPDSVGSAIDNAHATHSVQGPCRSITTGDIDAYYALYFQDRAAPVGECPHCRALSLVYRWPPCGEYTSLRVKTIFISHYSMDGTGTVFAAAPSFP